MPKIEEAFVHKVDVWTVGDLKKALADIPDDTELRFSPAEAPGSNTAAEEQVAYTADMQECWDRTSRSTFSGFVIELEFPPGNYTRTAWKDE